MTSIGSVTEARRAPATSSPPVEPETVTDLRPRSHLAQWIATAGPALAIGAVGALVGLDRAPFWRDEAYTLGAIHQLPETIRDTGGTMALYYSLLRVWGTVSESVWWLRSLSVALALAALGLFVALAARVVGPATARLAGVLLALSTLWVAYAQEARSYALVMLLVTGSWLALDRALAADETANRWWALHTLIGILLPLTHGLALLQVLAQPVALLVGRAGRPTWGRAVPGVAAPVVGSLGLAAVGATDVGSWVAPLDRSQVVANVRAFTSQHPVSATALLVVLAIGIAASVARSRSAAPGADRVRAVLPVAWAVVPPLALVLLSTVRPSLVPRYVVGSAPAVALLLALGCREIDRRLARTLPFGAALVVALLAVGQVSFHIADPAVDWRSAARTVAVEARPDDPVLLAESATRPVFEAAWREVPDPVPLPVVNGDRPLGRVLRVDPRLADDEAWAAARDLPRVWLVGQTGGGALDGARATLIEQGEHRVAGTWNVDEGVTVHLLVRSDQGSR